MRVRLTDVGIECWERNRCLEAEIQRETERKMEIESQIEMETGNRGDKRVNRGSGEVGGG